VTERPDPGPPADADDPHLRTYRDESVVAWYASRDDLKPAEAAIFDRLGEELSRAKLLDIGVGGGRTTLHLLPRVREYVGVDYSDDLVAATAARFPGARIEFADIRDLAQFADDEFDVVFFSFNGISSLGHEDRLRGLAEVRRVLRPGGAFAFSAHNRDHARLGLLPWQRPKRIGRPMLKKSWEAIRATPARQRMRRHELATEHYALVNDEAHNYELLHYYISPAAQVTQLHEAGFAEVEMIDMTGRFGTTGPDDIWMHYLAR